MPSRRRKHRKPTVTVDNPYFNRAAPQDRTNPARIKAHINRRESYPVYLYHRRTIDEAEFIAARRACAAVSIAACSKRSTSSTICRTSCRQWCSSACSGSVTTLKKR